MMLFKEQTSVEMLLKCTKSPPVKKPEQAVADRLMYQQHCDFLFAFFTIWCIKSHLPDRLGQLSFPCFLCKGVFPRPVPDRCSIHKSFLCSSVPRDLQEIPKIHLEFLRIKSFLLKLNGWRGTGIPKASQERTKMLIFSNAADAQNTRGLSHQRERSPGQCCFLGHR